MKNLKMFQMVFAIIAVSLLVGCSDQLTSPADSENIEYSNKTKKEVVPTVESLSADRYLRVQIRLKPNRIYSFNELNTGFAEINAISIDNLSFDLPEDGDINECSNITVYNTSDGYVLNCQSKGFKSKEIILVNTSSSLMDLDVVLAGIKKRIPVPVDSE